MFVFVFEKMLFYLLEKLYNELAIIVKIRNDYHDFKNTVCPYVPLLPQLHPLNHLIHIQLCFQMQLFQKLQRPTVNFEYLVVSLQCEVLLIV